MYAEYHISSLLRHFEGSLKALEGVSSEIIIAWDRFSYYYASILVAFCNFNTFLMAIRHVCRFFVQLMSSSALLFSLKYSLLLDVQMYMGFWRICHIVSVYFYILFLCAMCNIINLLIYLVLCCQARAFVYSNNLWVESLSKLETPRSIYNGMVIKAVWIRYDAYR